MTGDVDRDLIEASEAVAKAAADLATVNATHALHRARIAIEAIPWIEWKGYQPSPALEMVNRQDVLAVLDAVSS